MAMSRRTPRGGPIPKTGGRASDGARMVTPAPSASAGERMRAMMTPSRSGRVRLLGERLNADFFREAWAELRKVHWPTREQARNLTAMVIAVSIAVGVILGGVDYVFSRLFELILQIG
ncbi:MAG: preprotein translocase subunit SecE [Chloroflexota bacterium]